MDIKDMFNVSYDNDYFDRDDFGEDIDGNKVAGISATINAFGEMAIETNKSKFKMDATRYPLVAATVGVVIG